MSRFLVDECSRSNALWNAIQTYNQQHPQEIIDAIRVGDQGAPAFGTDDESLVKWAAARAMIIISRDTNTLAAIHDAFVSQENETPGVLFVRDGATLPDLIESISLVAHAAEPDFLKCRCEWIPFH